jgi:Zn-dependent protease
VFVSILIHEMGHVLVGNVFRSYGHIVLYSFGGLAIGSNRLSNRWQRVAVSFAGPFAQFLLLGVVFLVGFLVPRDVRSGLLSSVLLYLFIINLFWPVFNLLPIWPLDGGMIARELFEWASPRDGVRRSLIVSAGIAGVLAVLTLMEYLGRPLVNHPLMLLVTGGGGGFMVLYYAMFAVLSIQLLQQIPPSRRDYDDDDHLPWERQRPEPWERENDSWRR